MQGGHMPGPHDHELDHRCGNRRKEVGQVRTGSPRVPDIVSAISGAATATTADVHRHMRCEGVLRHVRQRPQPNGSEHHACEGEEADAHQRQLSKKVAASAAYSDPDRAETG